jgi:hypothetical protein
MLAPQLLDEIVDGHDSTRAGDQAGEDRAFLRSRDRQPTPAFLRDLKRSENEEAHGRRLTPVAEDNQTCDRRQIMCKPSLNPESTDKRSGLSCKR